MKFYQIGSFFLLLLLVNVSRAEDDLALPKKCEDLLNAEQCEKLRDLANAVKVKASEIDASIEAAIQSGVTKAKDIYGKVRADLLAKLQTASCEDLLSVEHCAKLKDFAATLKVKSAEVDKKIRELIAQGKTKASVIYKSAQQYYRRLLATKKCEDVLSAENCAKLRAAAAKAKAKAGEVDKAIREAVARGKVKANEIYEEALNFFRTRVLNKKCEDFLSPEACLKLRKTAATLKEKAELVDEYVKRAVLEGKKGATAIYKRTKDLFNDLVDAKTCDDLLPGETCDKLRELAQKLRLGTQKATEAVKKSVKEGYEKVSTITANAIEKVKDFAQNTKCEDILSASACAELREIAKKIKVGADKVEAAVKDAVAKSIFHGKDLMGRAKEFLQENISCEKVLGASACNKIRKFASYVGVAAEEIERVIKEKIMIGKDKLTEVYKAVLKFLKDKIWG